MSSKTILYIVISAIALLCSTLVLGYVLKQALFALHPMTVEVTGLMYPVVEDKLYRFIGRPYPESPVIEVYVHIPRTFGDRWKFVEVTVHNFIRCKFTGYIVVKFEDRYGNVVARGECNLVVRYKERVRKVIELTWVDNYRKYDVLSGHVVAKFAATLLPVEQCTYR